MYEDMMIQELNEDQLEQVVGGTKGGGHKVSNDVDLANFNTSSNTNTNTASSFSASSATGGSASATTGRIDIVLITI